MLASARGEKTTAHDEKFFSLRTVTDLQGLDQACLISAKNLYPKHRFFALFRRTFRDVTFESEVSFMSTLMEPDFLAMSERFAGKVHEV